VWLTAQDVVPGFQFAFILYGPTILEDNRDAGQRFMIAYLQGVRQYNEGKTARNLELISEFSGLDTELLQQACWIPIHSDGSVRTESVMEYQAWAVEKGFADGGITEASCWDGSFVQHANEVLGPASE
jgi:NitT/TauT family transport system substrate-binding protein